jgi:hypothetical protein
MLLKDTFTAQYFNSEIKVSEISIEANQSSSQEDVVKRDLLFDRIKKLYFAMKKLNQRLQKFLQESDSESCR